MTIELVSEENVKKRKRRLNDPVKSYNAHRTDKYEYTTKEKGHKRVEK